MRTRRSNRTKSYAVEEYHFGDSSAEEGGSTPLHHKTDDQDTNFEEANVAEDEDAAEGDGESGVSDSVSVADTTPARRRAAKSASEKRPQSTPKPARTTKLSGGYLEIPLPTQDGSHQPKTYIGPNDRAVRRHHLVSAWYGPDEQRMQTVQALLDRWFQWPVLPPRNPEDESNVASKGAWLDEYVGKEGVLAAGWRTRVDEAMGGHPPLRGLSPAEAAPYRFSTHSMPVLVGSEAREEFLFVPGSGYAISQSGVPFDHDESDNKEPSGWMFDTGGIVTSMDWAPRQREQATQLLAVAVMPHADQEVHESADEAAKMQFQSYGTVQLWEVQGETTDSGAAMATSSPPRLSTTLCLPHGRARRVRWNPVGGQLAVLCADGAVYVFVADPDSQGVQKTEEFGKKQVRSKEKRIRSWLT